MNYITICLINPVHNYEFRKLQLAGKNHYIQHSTRDRSLIYENLKANLIKLISLLGKHHCKLGHFKIV